MNKLLFAVTAIIFVFCFSGSAFCGEIHEAAKIGDIQLVKKILNSGGNINEYDDEGNTPLSLAIWLNWTDLAKFLIEKGAELNEIDEAGFTPLDMAKNKGNTELANILLKKGAKTSDEVMAEENKTALTAEEDEQEHIRLQSARIEQEIQEQKKRQQQTKLPEFKITYVPIRNPNTMRIVITSLNNEKICVKDVVVNRHSHALTQAQYVTLLNELQSGSFPETKEIMKLQEQYRSGKISKEVLEKKYINLYQKIIQKIIKKYPYPCLNFGNQLNVFNDEPPIEAVIHTDKGAVQYNWK